METQPSLIAILEQGQQIKKELAEVRATVNRIEKEMRDGFARMDDAFDKINHKLEIVAGDILDARTDTSRLRSRVQKLENQKPDPNAPTTRM